MFEPSGAELVLLVSTHLRAADVAKRRADNLAHRLFFNASRCYEHHAAEALEKATVCEIALQFEELAGLV